MITPTSSLVEIAFEVCTALDARGYTAVLTGGSAATFYAPDAYQSEDLDFVLAFGGGGGAEALRALGFSEQGGTYRHPQSRFSLEFPAGPLAIGEDAVTTWRTFRKGNELLHVLSPTDSCRDRLASYLFWNDFSGLEQAIAVRSAQAAEVDLEAVKAWCAREGHAKKYELFATRVGAQ